jgi:hypothetical protein
MVRQPHQRPRHEWLASWGTLISAIAAAVGLIVGGFSSCAAWNTARDTREALQRDLQRYKAEQASLIMAWEEHESLIPGRNKTVKLHVRNRSLDPVPQWFVAYADQDLSGKRLAIQVLESFNLPPCSELIINANQAFHSLDWQSAGKVTFFEVFEFWDTSGNVWTRDERGILKSGGDYAPSRDVLTSILTMEELVPRLAKVHALKECSAPG